MGVPIQRVYDIAVEMEKKFTAHDFKSGSAVRVYHDDGTDYWFENAFAQIYYDKDHGDEGMADHPGEWLMVFTEHHGTHVFHLDELKRGWSIWQKQEIPKHIDYPPFQWMCEICEYEMIEPTQFAEGPGCPMCGVAADGEDFKIKKMR